MRLVGEMAVQGHVAAVEFRRLVEAFEVLELRLSTMLGLCQLMHLADDDGRMVDRALVGLALWDQVASRRVRLEPELPSST